MEWTPLLRHRYATMAHARVVIRAWARDYNEERPHSALGYQTPKAFAERLFTATGSSAAPDESSVAGHWKHIRTSNPIESTFATVRHRTKKTKGGLGRKTALAMTFRLMMSAKKKWRKLDGAFRLPEIIEGVEFKDGIKQEKHAA